jgi:phosphoribosylformimino-5-aminoimidazole carboxamide ribotide isomerase
MRATPAIDLREGACVQLVGGSYAEERVRRADPLSVAREWMALGFLGLHLVDLDAATGCGSNAALVREIISADLAETSAAGGIRERDMITELLAAGAARIVLGTRAVEDPAWLEEMAMSFPGEIIVAADVRGRQLVCRGWAHPLRREVTAFVEEIDSFPLAGILVTAVHKEGQMRGPDLDLVDEITERTCLPLHVSGGITTMDDLHAVAERGAAAAIIGMALYTGALDARAVAAEYGA